MTRWLLRLFLCVTAALAPITRAEVLDSAPGHYHLRQEGLSALPPTQLWQRLLEPSRWWSPAHTYSGDAGNLDLDARVGGYWRESWQGGAVAHGRVIFLSAPESLRLEAPFGPLQGLGAYTVWTITLEAAADGTRVVFEETAIAPPGADLETLAVAVDTVKSEAMRRLTETGEQQ